MMVQVPFEFWRATPIILASIGQTCFVLFYSVRLLGAGEWWRDPIGRALFIKSVTLTTLLDSLLLSYISRYIHGGFSNLSFHLTIFEGNIDYFIVVGLWLTTFGVYYQLAALIRSRFRER